MSFSEYSLAPSNTNTFRAGRTVRVRGGVCRVIRLGSDLRDRKLMSQDSSLVNIVRHVAITSGGMYPSLVISLRLRRTRSLVDERNFGNVGNGGCQKDPSPGDEGQTHPKTFQLSPARLGPLPRNPSNKGEFFSEIETVPPSMRYISGVDDWLGPGKRSRLCDYYDVRVRK